METKAFGGNSDSQEKRAASGGYGKGGYITTVWVSIMMTKTTDPALQQVPEI